MDVQSAAHSEQPLDYPDGHRSMVERIAETTLPTALDELIDAYDEVTDDREYLLWQWLYHVFPHFRLSCVPERYGEQTRAAKFAFSVFMTILDDLSERHRDRQTFEQGRSLPFDTAIVDPSGPGVDSAYLDILEESWSVTESILRDAPRYDRFREIFDFDLRQSLNTMDYNRLINEGPRLADAQGVELYDTHNMLLYIYVDIDLMFSPGFDMDDLATLRGVTWDAQKLARIGNWVTTWEREIGEKDYTSKVVIDAIERGVVTLDELDSDRIPDQDLIDRIRATDIEHTLLLQWNRIYQSLVSTDYDTTSVDVHTFVDGIRYLLEVDVKARGYK